MTTGTNPSTATGNNKYGVEVASWCAACHDRWHEIDGDTTNDNLNNTPATSDWKRHPVANRITGDGTANSGADVPIIRLDNYNNTSVATAVPVADLSKWYASPTSATDAGLARVFCLTCHFPHGSPYNDLLRWNYTSGTPTAGGQVGNSIPSNRGCQLCHNRGGF